MRNIMKLPLFNFRNVIELLSPSPPIDALEISDHGLKLVHHKGGRHNFAPVSLRLPSGIIEGGTIKNEEAFKKALIQLRHEADPLLRGTIHVIVMLAGTNLYTQLFRLPFLDENDLENAVELNMKVISPFEEGRGYGSWQVAKVYPSGEREILAAFLEKNIVDALVEVLNGAGFEVMVVGFQALAYARLIREKHTNLAESEAYVVIKLWSEGLSLFIVDNGHPYFDHFLRWNMLTEGVRDTNKDLIENAILEEVQKIVNFYSSRFGSKPAKLIFVNSSEYKDVDARIKERIDIPLQYMALSQFPNVPPDWWAVLGAFFRANKPRSADNEINLAISKNTNSFYRMKMLVSLRFWRKIMWGSLLILIVMFVGGYVLIHRELLSTEQELSALSQEKDPSNLNDLESNAERFNNLVKLIGSLESQIEMRSSILEAFLGITAGKTTLQTIAIDGLGDKGIHITGVSDSQESVVEFKNIIEKSTFFKGVELPLQSVIQGSDGKWRFEMSFELEMPSS